MNYTVAIDTLKLQAVFVNNHDQHKTMNNIIEALLCTYSSLSITYDKGKNNTILIHSIHTAGTKILELKSGRYKDRNKVLKYYISIEFAGLKRYNKKIDTICENCLIRVAAYLNTHQINFFYTGIDIAVDIKCSFENTYAFCNKKAARVKYYCVNEYQPHSTTHYIEKYNRTHKRVMKRAYLYDKSKKSNGLTFPLTRFELKLQSSFFNRYFYGYGMLQDELDRYHILCFETLKQKDAALFIYGSYENSIRRRDLHKLVGITKHRIRPNTKDIEMFLYTLHDVYESDLKLPTQKDEDMRFD